MLYVASLDLGPDRDSHWVTAFGEAGLDVQSFPVSEQLRYHNGVIGKVERRLHIGTRVAEMRRLLVATVKQLKPDWVHFRLPIMFDRATINAIKGYCGLVTEYCNDDPFSPHRTKWYWHLYQSTIPLFDAHFIYRARNVADLIAHGARLALHTPPCYVPWRHHPPEWSIGEAELYRSDASFVGHWERDERLAAIDALLVAGFNVTLRGGMWNDACAGHPTERLTPVVHAFGVEYNKIYAGAAAGLCFFSKINRDELTERALEIPAVGGLLVCERTAEVARVFQDRREAFFFSDIDELVDIVRLVSRNDAVRASVAAAGRTRLLQGGHTVSARVSAMIKFLADNDLTRWYLPLLSQGDASA